MIRSRRTLKVDPADIGIISWVGIFAVVIFTVPIAVVRLAILDPAAHDGLGLAGTKVLLNVIFWVSNELSLGYSLIDVVNKFWDFLRLVFLVEVCTSIVIVAIKLPPFLSNLFKRI